MLLAKPNRTMKTIKQDELFQNLNEFLKAKGVNLTAGAYAQRIRQGCNLLTDAINAAQSTVKHAKETVDRKLDHFRQSIHEATAPKPPSKANATAEAAPPVAAPPVTSRPQASSSVSASPKRKQVRKPATARSKARPKK